jgi:hypothetical protein
MPGLALACALVRHACKKERTVLLNSAHSPDLAHFKYHLFSPVNFASRGSHLAEENGLKHSFRDVMCSEVEAGNFTTLVTQRLTQRDKSVLKMAQTSWTSSLKFAKGL